MARMRTLRLKELPGVFAHGWAWVWVVLASIGFTAYSALVGNAVFSATNALILVSAVFGQLLYWRNQRKPPKLAKALAREAGVSLAAPKRKSRRTEASSRQRRARSKTRTTL